MRVLSSFVIAALLLGSAGSAWAGDKDKREEHRKKVLEKFDKDGDGKLSDAEKQAAKEGRKEHHGKRKHHRKELLKKFDKDGDGKLSDAEKQAAKDAMKEHRKKKGGDKKSP